MKALTTLKSAINQSSVFGSIALIVLSPFTFPHLALAAVQPLDNQAQVFEINVPDSTDLNPSLKQNDTQTSITLDTIVSSDPLVENLDAFLVSKSSPLAGSADKLVTYPHWQLALSISVVESNMCRFTPKVKTKKGWIESYNCSGIGGSNYKMYDSYLGWFSDMNKLLGQPNYINRPIEKFIGYYVVPGGANWLNGVKKTKRDLIALEEQAGAQRQERAQIQLNKIAASNAILTFAENSN